MSEVCWNASSWLTCCLSLTSCSFCQAITRLISAGSARVVPPADIFPSCSFTPGKLGTPKQSPLFVGTTTFRGSTSGRDWLGLVASLQKHNRDYLVIRKRLECETCNKVTCSKVFSRKLKSKKSRSHQNPLVYPYLKRTIALSCFVLGGLHPHNMDPYVKLLKSLVYESLWKDSRINEAPSRERPEKSVHTVLSVPYKIRGVGQKRQKSCVR